MGKPSRPELPTPITAERDSARQAEDLAAFRRMMVASSGTFSLSFVVCQNPALQRALIAEFRTEFPGILVVALPEGVGDVFAHVVSIAPSEMPEAIFILGMEASIPFEGTVQPAIRVLNSSREQWERFHCPVVFWLADYALARLSTHAPDFWRYRSHQFEFMPEDPSLERAVQERFPGQATIRALPYEEKKFRLSELETRLQGIGSSPSADLLPHAVGWSYELAELYMHSNRFEEAERLLRRTLDWQTAARGDSSEETATALNNLAQLFKATNRMAEAEPLMRRSLSISEAAYGKDHPAVAIDLSNLATLLQATNRIGEAEPLMRRSLAIDEAAFGKDHPTVAIRLNNLAALLQATNRLAEAEPLMRRSLAIDEAAFGDDHPNVANRLNNLATLLWTTNRLAEAEPLMRRVVAIFAASLGENHTCVATAISNLATLLQTTNRMAEAEPLMRRALAIDEAAYGKEHPNVAIRLNNLATLLRATNRLGEAVPLMREAVRIFEKSLGREHPNSVGARKNSEFLQKEMKGQRKPLSSRIQPTGIYIQP